MLRITERRVKRLLLLASLPLVLVAPSLNTPARAGQKKAAAPPASAASAAAADDNKNDPPYHDYKGVRIGMTADEARKKLGDPADKGDKQDFYSFSGGNEMAQVFYDAEKKVFAVSVIYMNGGDKAPTCKSVLGTDVEIKPDGSMHRKVDYPKAGFWVAYSRTAGDSPLVTVTMQKKLQ